MYQRVKKTILTQFAVQYFAVVSHSPDKSIDEHEPAGKIGGEVVQSTCLDFHHGGDEKQLQTTACKNSFFLKNIVYIYKVLSALF